MPKKTFIPGEVLTAANVNTFLMDQSVMTFADSASRGSAIGTATEGMVSYLNNTNSLELYDGSSWGQLNPSSGNAVINGAFEINQRVFTSSTADGAYGFDRFRQAATDGTVTYSAQAFTPGTGPAGYEAANFARIVTTGQTLTTAAANLQTRIEDVRTLAGQTATISFYAKAASGTPNLSIELEQNFGSGGSPSASVQVFGDKVTLSTSWQRFSATVSVPSITGKTIGTTANSSYLSAIFWVSAGSTLNARTSSLGIQLNTFDIWGVQVEAGSVATPFKRNADSIQGELAACQRYYYRAANSSSSFGTTSLGWAGTTTSIPQWTTFPVTMRVKPTAIEFGNLILSDAVTTFAISALVIDSNVSSVSHGATVATTTGATAFRPMYARQNSNSAGFLAFSAEL
jgi:hypothetical protein